MAAGSYIIAMTGPGDTAEGLDRFVNAMGELDRELEKNVLKTKSDVFKILKQEMKYTSWEAGAFSSSGMKTEVVPWSKAAGRTAMEYAYLYPPGIPFIVPGEKIGHGTAVQIEAYEEMGFTIEEAAECTGIGRNTMRKLVDWGKLPVLKVGRKTIIRRDTLERFMTVNQGRNLLKPDDVRKVE